MDIETFRWFMSTVAQTLGALTAIVVAVYVMWISRLRFLQQDISSKAKKLFKEKELEASKILIKYNCKDYLELFNKETLDQSNPPSSYLENSFLDHRKEFRRRGNDIKQAQQLWKPITLSLITVFSSLVLLGIDRIIIPNIANSVWGWICFSLVCVFVLISLFLYFRFLFDVVAPYYSKHSRWTRFWKGLFDKDYPYNQKED